VGLIDRVRKRGDLGRLLFFSNKFRIKHDRDIHSIGASL
jgi:hypothetical protein